MPPLPSPIQKQFHVNDLSCKSYSPLNPLWQTSPNQMYQGERERRTSTGLSTPTTRGWSWRRSSTTAGTSPSGGCQEFHIFAKSECYIVVRRRKAELAQALNLTERQVGWVGSATIKREACLTKENPHTAKKIKCLKVIFDEHDNPNFFVPHEKFMRLLHRRPFYLLLC